MLEPFSTLQQSGLAQPHGGADKLDGWSPELLVSLDWVRLAELARGLTAEAGCELAGSRNFPDGSVMFAMIERPRSTTPQRALVKLAPWNEWGATPETVEHFAKEVATARNSRGFLIAPAGFSTAAFHTAQKHRIEAVDAAALHSALSALRPEKSEIMFAVATTGDYGTPTCPICNKRLHRTEQMTASLPSRTMDVTGLIADSVVCDQLVITESAEATFLQEVRCCSLIVRGQADGNFVCHGPVTLESGGILSGTVAARSLNVRDGGQLLGQFHILEGKLESLIKNTARWQWRCANAENALGCSQVAFEPHDVS